MEQSQRTGHVHIVQRLSPGGIETLALDLIHQSNGDRIISLEGSTDQLIQGWDRLANCQHQIIGLNKRRGIDPALINRLVRLMRHLKPRSVALHHIRPLLYGGPAARIAGIPNIIHVEHDAWHYDNSTHRHLTRLLERTTTPHHVAVCDAVADRLGQILPTANIAVIPNGVDVQRFKPGCKLAARQRLGLPPSAKLVGAVSRLVPVKGIDTLLDAAAGLSKTVHIAIVGDGPERAQLQQAATASDRSSNIHFLGHRDDIPDILPAFDLYCMPSHNEGLPRGILEAQACALPVVATDVGAICNAVSAMTSMLVPPANPVALRSAITTMLGNKDASSARDFVKRHFNWQQTIAAYRTTMENGYAA